MTVLGDLWRQSFILVNSALTLTWKNLFRMLLCSTHAQKFTSIDHIFTSNLRLSQLFDAYETGLFDFHKAAFNSLQGVS